MRVYLDNQATTRCDDRVVEKMLPFFTDYFGNPSSEHLFGYEANDALEEARGHVAALIGARPEEIIFTSGATESNNMVIKGAAAFYKTKTNIITTPIEHKCVINSCRRMSKYGMKIKYLDVNSLGIIDLEDLASSIDENTLMVSVIFAHNEIGVIQPIREIGEICSEHGVIFHTDAAQAAGKLRIDVDEMNIDFLSLSSHKIYGPKGVGALFRRMSSDRRFNLIPLLDGGGQESGFRSGTVPVPLCVGFGEACRIAAEEMDANNKKIRDMQRALLDIIMSNLDGVHINGDRESRVPGNLNLSFNGVESEALIFGLKTVAISSGSACSSSTLEPSYVLKAIGVTDNLINSSVRISIGKFNTIEEIEFAGNAIINTVKRLREISAI